MGIFMNNFYNNNWKLANNAIRFGIINPKLISMSINLFLYA